MVCHDDLLALPLGHAEMRKYDQFLSTQTFYIFIEICFQGPLYYFKIVQSIGGASLVRGGSTPWGSMGFDGEGSKKSWKGGGASPPP